MKLTNPLPDTDKTLAYTLAVTLAVVTDDFLLVSFFRLDSDVIAISAHLHACNVNRQC
jgi:hypothetical protein